VRRLLALATASATLAACATGGSLRAQADVIKIDLEKAKKSGAMRCAPRELAIAERNLEFLELELSQGNAIRGSHHVEVAHSAVKKALILSKDCGPTQVLVKTPEQPKIVKIAPKDTDGDGLTDNLDKCPNDPEDFDGFQDDDGCPEPDNDQDGVPDVTDRCPLTPGPADNQGCPREAPKDSDGDGIPDDIDRCPADPEDRDGFEDDDGCPDPDNDQDGVIDPVDACPMDAGPASNKGCPILDRDGDGIVDDLDRCPDEPEDKDGFEDTDGCPDLDNDQDGIADARDKCPNEAGPKENEGCPDKDTDGDTLVDRVDRCPREPGIPELKGCPPKDSDGDGIPDHLDKCPDQPGVVEEQGCPKKYTLVVLKKEEIQIKQQVLFDTNKHIIKPASFELLQQVAQVLKDYPKIVLRIEGHTDSKADDDFNLKLSDKRAGAVMAFLIKEGIDPARMTSVGYGETQPIASNATEKGRSQNRRVVFRIVSQ
jgi:outer membrane protein OmpA-like peptidoglycan-associated protein